MKTSPLVSIDCITYNHAPYIRQCLEGFLMQKTNFSFEVLIHDDASTDGTPDIIREYELKYPEIIKPIYQTENQWSKGVSISATFNFPRAKGKYIALCEGDDYWTDPLKLQKQVDFLEANPEYGLVHTDVNFYYQLKNKFECSFFKSHHYNIQYTFDDFLINAWFLAPCTWIFKASLLNIYYQEQKFIIGDFPLLLSISLYSKIKFLSQVTAVYRVLDNSASHITSFEKQIQYQSGILKIQHYFMKISGKNHLNKEILDHHYLILVKHSFLHGKYKNFITNLSIYSERIDKKYIGKVVKFVDNRILTIIGKLFFYSGRKIYYFIKYLTC